VAAAHRAVEPGLTAVVEDLAACALAAAGLSHPNICQLHEVEETDDGLVTAMDLVPILIVVTTRDHSRPPGYALETR
jgi:hypothetical protein